MIDGISGTVGAARSTEAPKEERKVEENRDEELQVKEQEEVTQETRAEVTGKGQEVDTTA